MSDPNFFIIYVDKPLDSAAFYAQLLGQEPIESSPTFAMFALKSGLMLAMWSKHTVAPEAQHTGGGSEIAFALENRAAVEDTFTAWTAQKLQIAQDLTDMEFGYTFVALDPDCHRLRVFTPNLN